MKERFNTIDGETLMNQPLKPMKFIIDTLLSQGLHILAGSPKVGKSWLALWLSVSIANGEAVWNNKVQQGSTLYLCFEDSRLRIQNRLFEITDSAPPQAHFCEECFMLGGALENRMETFLEEHPDTVLIIIDTLQMIRKPFSENSYANDYADLTSLKKLADKHGIAILLIHHLRKQKDDDPFNRISGTTGLSGVVDSSFTLVEEQRGSGRAKLFCIGRDIEYREIELRRNDDNVWEVVTDSLENPDVLLDDIILLVSEFMKDRKEYTGTPTQLAELLSTSVYKVSKKYLSRLLKDNEHALHERGLRFELRRSDGLRLITLFSDRADSDGRDDENDSASANESIDPVDPVVTALVLQTEAPPYETAKNGA